jgi:signal transduction histidine kinase
MQRQRVELRQIINTEAIAQRPVRKPDYAAENRALVEMARTLSRTPALILDALAQKALELCSGGSAGISILDQRQRNPTQFRWYALAGAWKPYLGAAMPRNNSPCGVVLERNAPQLMNNLAAYYDYVEQISPACYEVLLVPFYANDIAVGTIWVVKHDQFSRFDAEDQRILGSLATFTSAAYELLKQLEILETHGRQHADEIASLSDADRSKDAFIATIAHELRNPLAPLRNSAMLLARGFNDQLLVKRAAAIIDHQVSKLSRLIEDLMDVSRVRLGNLKLDIQVVELNEIIASAAEDSTLLTTPTSHHLQFEPLGTQIRVLGDPGRLTQVFENLFNNAAKYTDQSGTIAVRAFREGTSAVVQMQDTGIGIAPDQMESIFDLFAQAGQSGTPRSQGGLGIGLHLARQIVEAHRGTLSAASDGPGCGSTFTIRLPLAEPGNTSTL